MLCSSMIASPAKRVVPSKKEELSNCQPVLESVSKKFSGRRGAHKHSGGMHVRDCTIESVVQQEPQRLATKCN